MGSIKRKGDPGTEQDFKVVKLIKHPEYHSPVRYAHDIALLQLDRPAVVTKWVSCKVLSIRGGEGAKRVGGGGGGQWL